MDTKLIEEMVREVMKQVASAQPGGATGGSASGLSPAKDYPLAEKRPDLIKTTAGKSMNELTLEKVMNGSVTAQDFRITADALLLQAEIAEGCGRTQLAENFRRSAELTKVGDSRILEIYNALRPYRATKQELLAIAQELEEQYGAKMNAALVREAADVYERRGRLKTA